MFKIISFSSIKKLWGLFTKPQKRNIVILFVFMLLGMVFETFGIGLVIPALALMLESNITAKFPVLAPVLNFLGNPSRDQLVLIGMLTLVCVYIIKSLFLTFLIWKQMKFVYNVRADLSLRLFNGYIRQPYTFHLQRNSAQLINNVTNEVLLLSGSCLTLGLAFLTETLVLIGISVLLLVVEPLGALMVIVITCIAGLGFHYFTKKHILRWGEARQRHEGLRIQHLQQGIGGVKEIKLLGREESFLKQYQVHNFGSANSERRMQIITQIPRLWFEFLAVMGLITLVLAMMVQGKPMEVMVSTLGLFAAAAFRLMPSVNRILGAIQNINYAVPVIDTLYNELQMLNNQNNEKSSNGPVIFKKEIKLENVCFQYPTSDLMNLKNINMKIHFGDSIGIIGGSGAGKSTLIDIILGLLLADSGRISVDGEDIKENIRGWQNMIGYVPQSIFLTDDTLKKNIALGLSDDQINEDALKQAILLAQLDKFVDSLSLGLDTFVGERGVRLSGGQRQRIGIARALYHNPSVLVMDEATNALDIHTEKTVMEAVQALQGRKTIIIVSHRMSAVERCNQVYRLENGQLI